MCRVSDTKGNGKREAQLTDNERLVLARIESGVAASGRRGNGQADRPGRPMDISDSNVSDAPDSTPTRMFGVR